MKPAFALILSGSVAAAAIGLVVSRPRAPHANAPVARGDVLDNRSPSSSAPEPRPEKKAPPPPDFEHRGCDHPHAPADAGPAEPLPTPPDPWTLPDRAVRRIERDLDIEPGKAREVARILGDHLESIATLEAALAGATEALDSTVTGEAWARTEERLAPLLSPEQLDRLKLIPFEPPPAARRDGP